MTPVKRGRGRPRKYGGTEPAAAPVSSAPPVATAEPPSHGYTRIYLDETGAALAEPLTESEPRKAPPKPAPAPAPTEDVTLASDEAQRALIDEYGELARKVLMHAATAARFELLKGQIKAWFDSAPCDADGDVDGVLYRIHVTARERERRVRSMSELYNAIGLEKFLEVATVTIGALEDAIGKTRAAAFVVEEQTGSRRIKPIAKFAAVAPAAVE